MLLGAGALSLALEAVVQRTSGADEGSWIEGASILAAGGFGPACMRAGTELRL